MKKGRGESPKRLITKEEWIELIPYIRQRLNEDGITYEFLGKELGRQYAKKKRLHLKEGFKEEDAVLSRSRIEQVVKFLNANYNAGIQLRRSGRR